MMGLQQAPELANPPVQPGAKDNLLRMAAEKLAKEMRLNARREGGKPPRGLGRGPDASGVSKKGCSRIRKRARLADSMFEGLGGINLEEEEEEGAEEKVEDTEGMDWEAGEKTAGPITSEEQSTQHLSKKQRRNRDRMLEKQREREACEQGLPFTPPPMQSTEELAKDLGGNFNEMVWMGENAKWQTVRVPGEKTTPSPSNRRRENAGLRMKVAYHNGDLVSGNSNVPTTQNAVELSGDMAQTGDGQLQAGDNDNSVDTGEAAVEDSYLKSLGHTSI